MRRARHRLPHDQSPGGQSRRVDPPPTPIPAQPLEVRSRTQRDARDGRDTEAPVVKCPVGCQSHSQICGRKAPQGHAPEAAFSFVVAHISASACPVVTVAST